MCRHVMMDELQLADGHQSPISPINSDTGKGKKKKTTL